MSPWLIVLVCHGSRDPRYQSAFQGFVQACSDALAASSVVAAQLECAEISLGDQLLKLSNTHAQMILVPLFMGGGVHVCQDLPAAIEAAQSLNPDLVIRQTRPIGQAPAIVALLQERILDSVDSGNTKAWGDAWIILGHGSRSSGFAENLAHMIRQVAIQAEIKLSQTLILPAFWAQAPKLVDQVQWLYHQGYRKVQVAPFFLFPGGILDQITQEAADSGQQLPGLQLKIGDVLAPDPWLIQAVNHCITECIAEMETPEIDLIDLKISTSIGA